MCAVGRTRPVDVSGRSFTRSPARRHIVIVALEHGRRDCFDLRIGQTETALHRSGLRITRLGIRQVESGRTGFEDDIAQWGIRDVGETLRR